MKILYGMMESHKTRELTNFSLKTWFKDKKLYIFTDKENDDSRFVKITSRDDYHSNAIKCVLGLRYMFEQEQNFDYYVFLDNDTYINFDNLEEYLSDKDPYELKAYGSLLNHWSPDKSLYYLSGGASFVVPNITMKLLYEKLEKDESLFVNNYNDFSDVTVGVHMRELGIELCDSDLFHSQPPEFYNHSEEDIKESISYHYINSEQKIKQLNDIFNGNYKYKIISTLHGYKDKKLPIDSFKKHNIYEWYVPSVRHCRKINPECEFHILTDLDFGDIFKDDEYIFIHDLENSKEIDFLKENYKHLSPNPEHMEFNSLIRFVYLKNFCENNYINEFLYLEPDVLVFSDILEDRKKLKQYDVTLMLEKCAGVCFFNNGIKVLNEICQVMINSYSGPQIEPKAFDYDFYKESSMNNYIHGGVSDMHFWNWYSRTHDRVFKNMDQNIDDIFWHTCITRSSDDSEISIKNWTNHVDEDINKNVKDLTINNNKCFSTYKGKEVEIKYLHFNENTKKIIPKYV